MANRISNEDSIEGVSLDSQTAIDVSDHLETRHVTEPFVGQWSQLISRTNWEKGRIIQQWREALRSSGAPVTAYSDEAWSRCVGGITSSHVGRLRRVYERFGNVYETYAGIFWTHFLAALDWDDAEMWLEGASQSRWSVSEMRRTRWQANGGDPASEPVDSDVVTAEIDEDFTPLAEADDFTAAEDNTRSVAEGPRPEEPDFGDEQESGAEAIASDDDLPWEETEAPESPFAALPSLPVDLAEALEQFKLGIIRHRANGWNEVSQSDVLRALDALKAFCQS